MRNTFFTRIVLFLVAVCGWAIIGFGGWIAWRGLVLYAADPVLMGTGGGLAIGGLVVVALALAARMQVRTAETAAAILDRLDALARRDRTRPPASPEIPATGRQEPRITLTARPPDASPPDARPPNT